MNTKYVYRKMRKLYLTEDGKKWLAENFPCKSNKDCKKILQVTDETMYRWVIELGLKKSEEWLVIANENRKDGVRKFFREMSDELREEWRGRWEKNLSGDHTHTLRKWMANVTKEEKAKVIKKRIKSFKRIYEVDKYRESWGLERKTKFKYGTFNTRAKCIRANKMRFRLRRKGYIVNTMEIYYNDTTIRSEMMEDNAIKMGFVMRGEYVQMD